MATAYTYSFSKRHNSTAVPSGSGTSVDFYLKGGSDILAPVFTFNSQLMPTFDYILWNGRYYFVTGIKNVRNELWEISAAVDVLATWKGSITASSGYVLYYTHSNTQIADRRLAVSATKDAQSNTGSFGFLGKNYAYVLTVIGKDETASFALNEAQIKALYAQDYQTAFDNTIDGIPNVQGVSYADTLIDLVRWWKDYLKSAAGAFNYAGTISENIKSCLILPISIGAIGGTPSVPLYLGAIDTGVTGLRITDRTFTDTCSVTIPWQATDWRRLEPYHEIFLYIPALGLISLSPSDLIGNVTLDIKVCMDVLSGDAIFEVKCGGRCVYYSNTNLGTPFALGSSQSSPANVANALLGTAAALSGNPAAILGGALGIANAIKPNPMCIGSNAGGAILGIGADTVACYTIFHDTTVSPSSVSAIKGTPYNGVMSLSGITGYVQCDDFSVAGIMTDTEREQINQLVNGGIYIE